MNIPFVDLKTQYLHIRREINEAVARVFETATFVLGPSVEEFERQFALAHSVNHCVGLSSGTDGNHLGLWVLGIKPHDEVIIPANTFVATAWGATLSGAKPVFVDAQPDSYNIDPERIQKAISSKTKAVVAVHLYGQPADMDSVKSVCDGRGIHIVEDCAQSHFAEYKHQMVGGLSDIASFSFYPGKNLGAYGEAGAITTNNEALAKNAKMIRDHGASQKYNHEVLGHNYRMEGIQGAILGVKMRYIRQWTEQRRQIARKYTSRLSEVGDVIIPPEMPYSKHVYHLYVIQTKERDRLQKYLAERGISTGLHYPVPLHLQPCFSSLGYRKGDFPVSEKLANQCISLPMFPELSDDQLEYVVGAIRNFFN